MRSRVITLFILFVITVSLWLANHNQPNVYLEKAFYTAFTLLIANIIFKQILETVILKRTAISKTRYSFKKALSVIYIFIIIFILIAIWIEDYRSLAIAYGIIAAGIAFALQDLFKNFVGGLIIIVSGIYGVGDRIEINSKKGDVIDIDILYTTLLELGGWMSGDQATGRLTIVPNGFVLSGNIDNYTKDHNFIWDDIKLPITYDSDWGEAIGKILTIVKVETERTAMQAEQELSRLEEKYYLPLKAIDPAIFITMTDNWIELNIRYVTIVRERRQLRGKLNKLILEEIERSENIKIASETSEIVGLPEIRLKEGP
jgi:small-conductance mechanosensitive channel